MKTNWLFLLIAILLVSCGSDESSSGVLDDDAEISATENNQGESTGKESGSEKPGEETGSEKDSGPEAVVVVTDPVIEDTTTVQDTSALPECTPANEGEALAVTSEDVLYFCIGGEWVANAQELFSLTCADGILKLDLTKMTDDASSTIETDLTQYRRTGMNLVGVAEKGPFHHGATIRVVELDSMMRLADSRRSFETCVSSANGTYVFSNVNLVSPYVRVEASGYYRNELTGGLSSSMIKLNAVTNLNKRDTVNVNMLTHLTSPRTLKLIEDSGNNQPIGAMGARALNEVLSAFEINLGGGGGNNGGGFGAGWGFGNQMFQNPTTSGKYAEDITLFDGDDYSAALLAVSIMMQSAGSVNDMLYLAGQISEDIRGDGNWGDNSTKAKIADKLMVLDTSGGFETIRKNIASWKLGEVPDFEKYVRAFWTKVHGFESCNAMTAGQLKHIGNSMSAYFVSYYEQPDGPRVRFICDPETHNWRAATDMEKDTHNFGPGEYDGQMRNGVINTDRYYIYEQSKKSWRAATADDIQEFEDIEDVYKGLASDEKVIFVLRHAERGDDTGKHGKLTDNGKKQSQQVGAKLKGETAMSLKNSTYTRSYETCENIAIGAGLKGAKQDTLPVLDGEWYVKDDSKFENYKNSDGGGWTVVSAYTYKGSYKDAFYDLNEKSEEFINDVVKPAFASANRVSVWVSHDVFMTPFTAYCTNKKVNLRYFETKRWINYLAGVAIIMDGKGNLRYVPVKGLGDGTMTL